MNRTAVAGATRSPLALLKDHFGHDQFRPLQEKAIASILAGNDAVILMPTGGGKSLCYQLPALALDGLTLVVSPLIALMKDQVDALRARGIAARCLNSSLSPEEARLARNEAQRGEVKLLYVAPERIAASGFQRFLGTIEVALVAVDEAHCISQWGHEFRPDYRNLGTLRELFPEVPFAAFTATATERVRRDIATELRMENPEFFVESFNRPNLTYAVRPKRQSFDSLVALLREREGESAIIYCLSRRETESAAERLQGLGFRALAYHAGLDHEKRRAAQDRFASKDVLIVVATIAFGMGIDMPDLRLIAHYNMPKSVEGYYQETGRAGRDGLPSDCVLFFSYADKAAQQRFVREIEDPAERRQAHERLTRMVAYCELSSCRRRYLLNYFSDASLDGQDNCGGCDICLGSSGEVEEYEATEIAQKILSGHRPNRPAVRHRPCRRRAARLAGQAGARTRPRSAQRPRDRPRPVRARLAGRRRRACRAGNPSALLGRVSDAPAHQGRLEVPPRPGFPDSHPSLDNSRRPPPRRCRSQPKTQKPAGRRPRSPTPHSSNDCRPYASKSPGRRNSPRSWCSRTPLSARLRRASPRTARSSPPSAASGRRNWRSTPTASSTRCAGSAPCKTPKRRLRRTARRPILRGRQGKQPPSS